MCNPVSLFEAKIEKYCPQDFLDIKVSWIKNGASTKTHLSKNWNLIIPQDKTSYVTNFHIKFLKVKYFYIYY